MHRLAVLVSIFALVGCGARIDVEEAPLLEPAGGAGASAGNDSDVVVIPGTAGSASTGGMPSSGEPAGGASAGDGNPVAGTGGAAVTPEKEDDSAARAACMACNGAWGRHGLSSLEGCNCRTTDVGRACSDNTACEGQCLADKPSEIVTDIGPPRLGYFVGQCSEFQASFGCHAVLSNGYNTGAPVLLDEPLTLRCWD